MRRATGGAAPWTPEIWVARRPLARVVGEEFFVRARCGFAAILDVWQEAAPPPWRKRPGEHRRHTGGGQPSQEKNRVKLLKFGFFSDLVRYRRICAVRFSIHAPHCCGGRASGPSAPPGGWYMGYGFAGMRRSSVPHTARRHTQVPPYIPGRTPIWSVGRDRCVPSLAYTENHTTGWFVPTM